MSRLTSVAHFLDQRSWARFSLVFLLILVLKANTLLQPPVWSALVQLRRLGALSLKPRSIAEPLGRLSGIGIWDGEEARYYPYDRITTSGNAVVDEFAGRQLVVYLAPRPLPARPRT